MFKQLIIAGVIVLSLGVTGAEAHGSKYHKARFACVDACVAVPVEKPVIVCGCGIPNVGAVPVESPVIVWPGAPAFNPD